MGRRSLALGPIAVVAAMAILIAGAAVSLAQPQHVGQVTGLPLPRFVSLGAERVNVRRGPGADYPLAWTFVRAGLPVEVTQEFDVWRRIRTSTGEEGWVLGALLSSNRTAVVSTIDGTTIVPLYGQPSQESQAVARLEVGVLGIVSRCNGEWCRFTVSRYVGWIQQDRLWGVYPGEVLD
jgi:SH3-like domain-containing protein